MADRRLRIAQGGDFVRAHAQDVAVAAHDLAVPDNEVGAEQAGIHHQFDCRPVFRFPDAGIFVG